MSITPLETGGGLTLAPAEAVFVAAATFPAYKGLKSIVTGIRQNATVRRHRREAGICATCDEPVELQGDLHCRVCHFDNMLAP